MRTHISTHWLRLLFEYLQQQGRSGHEILGQACPEAGELERIPVARWRAALRATGVALDDPAPGLNFAASVRLHQLGVLGYVASVAPTLADALRRLQSFERLVYQIDPMHIRLDGDLALLEWHTKVADPGQLVDETAIATLVTCSRELSADSDMHPSWVSFVNPVPSHQQAYREFFQCDVSFDAPSTVVALPLARLSQTLPKPDPALLAILDQQAAMLLQQIPGEDVFETDLRRALTQAIAGAQPTLARLAQQLHCSPRTLQRRLDQRQLKFQTLLDDSRRQLAQQYLADRSMPMSEIALLLGYSEQSAFNRAFKRWTGHTPRAARNASALKLNQN